MNEFKQKPFEVGDEVLSPGSGWGQVEKIRTTTDFTVVVRFENGESTFTQSAKELSSQVYPTLFHANQGVITIGPMTIDTDKPVELPDWEVDKPIWVRNHDSDSWFRRHFAHFASGMAGCFKNGRTSFTGVDEIHFWNQFTNVKPANGESQ